VARCFNQAYGLQLSVRGEMECAYQGERLTPSLCGRMVGKHVSSCPGTRLAAHRSNHPKAPSQQAIACADLNERDIQDQCCAFGRVPLLMLFEGEALTCEQLCLGAPLHLVLVDLRCMHVAVDTPNTAKRQRRTCLQKVHMHDAPYVPCRAGKDTVQILADLQDAYPEAATPQHAALHDLLGATNERITGTAISLLAAGDARGLGAAPPRTLIMMNCLVDRGELRPSAPVRN
jgi:galactokinase